MMKIVGGRRQQTPLAFKIAGGVLVVVVSFAGGLLVLDTMWPSGGKAPALIAVPPLQPVTRTPVVIAPTAIALSAIRDSMDAAAPRNLAGKRENPLGELLSKAEIGWTMARGAMVVTGRPEGLTISTPLTGALRATGQIATQAGNLTGAIGGLLNNALGRDVQGITGRALDQRADIRGNAVVTSRPTILPNWRLEPNLTGQVTLAEAVLSVPSATKSNPWSTEP